MSEDVFPVGGSDASVRLSLPVECGISVLLLCLEASSCFCLAQEGKSRQVPSVSFLAGGFQEAPST